MGSVEDKEPPSKRLRSRSPEVGYLSNNSSNSQLVHPSGGLMAKHLPSHGEVETVGSKGVIKRVEFVRIITKALYSLGYERSGALLEEESGIDLHSSVVNLFRKQLLDGDWDESVKTLHKIGIMDEKILKSASFLILEHKFFEFLEKNQVMDALRTLRKEITPLDTNEQRVQELSGCIISHVQWGNGSNNGICAKVSNPRLNLLEELQKLLPPAVMIPERRLEHLIEQALTVQRKACVFHNSLDSSLSLYSDHRCGRDLIPSTTLQVLHEHTDDVWFLRFSNNGQHLASASSDKSTIIWKVNNGGQITLKHTLTGHQKPVLMVAWSPDDSMLLTCGMTEVVRCWDVSSGDCIYIYEKIGLGLISCGWFPDGKTIVTGLSDQSICTWNLDGAELESWKGQRTISVSDLTVTQNCKWIITICKETAILLFDKERKVEKLIEEDQTIISFTLSRNDKLLLVNLLNEEIHLWSIEVEFKLLAKYKGHKRSRFVIRSCFGGFDQAFIASGSEDSQVYIWLRSTGELISTLSGHSGTVNCVSWNPTDPHILASGSDDHTIRIWGLDSSGKKCKDIPNNGVVSCNGTTSDG